MHAQHGNDRQAIAAALGLTPQQIDQLQREAMKIANELTPDTVIGKPTGGHENIYE